MPEVARPRIGLAGLGLMGTVIARRLMAAGFTVAGYDIAADARTRLIAAGGHVDSGITDLARTCPHVVLAVFDTEQVEDVITGPAGLLSVPADERRTTHAIVTSTCDPDRVAALGPRAAAAGLTLLEMPISGTSQQVAEGDGYGLVAGDAAASDMLADLLAVICPRSVHMGALGNGTRTKLAINHILGLNRAALAEGLVLADRLGLPLDAFLEAAKASAAYSQIMNVKGAKMIAGDFTPHGKVAQSLKDFGLIIGAARQRGQSLPLAEVYAALMAGCVAAGEGDLDNAAIIAEIARRGTSH